jgi:Domain of unknown function (DUF4304)
MINSKSINEIIKNTLSAAGYIKKSDTWYLRSDEAMILINIQKSQYGNQFYINCGVSLNALISIEFPKEHQCSIRFRIEDIVSSRSENSIAALLNLEDVSISESQRKDGILELIVEYALPTLNTLSTIKGIGEAIRSGALANAMIHKHVKELVKINLDTH